MDTSAFLAFANREPGAEKVRPILKEAVVSAVNVTEILQKLATKKMTPSKAQEYLQRFVSEIVPFDLEQAALTAALHTHTQAYGLSMGDHACLALAKHLNVPVLTADQVWAKLEIGVRIELIRGNPS